MFVRLRLSLQHWVSAALTHRFLDEILTVLHGPALQSPNQNPQRRHRAEILFMPRRQPDEFRTTGARRLGPLMYMRLEMLACYGAILFRQASSALRAGCATYFASGVSCQ